MQEIDEMLEKISDMASSDFSCMHECYSIDEFMHRLNDSRIDVYSTLFKYYKKQYEHARENHEDWKRKSYK